VALSAAWDDFWKIFDGRLGIGAHSLFVCCLNWVEFRFAGREPRTLDYGLPGC